MTKTIDKVVSNLFANPCKLVMMPGEGIVPNRFYVWKFEFRSLGFV